MVGPPYHSFVAICRLAQSGWDGIEGEAAWRGIDPWRFPTLSQWCSFVVHFYRTRTYTEEDRARLESLLDQPNPRLHLYTLARAGQQRVAQPTALEEFQQMQQQIAAAKAGG